ncbi:MAG: energy-coupling factor ABC transporter ATP-binding protein [Desulfobacteraceae bacterium]
MNAYELEDIAHGYDGQTVLTIEDWTAEEGTVSGVVGPNGSGKSTLLSLLGFVTSPTQGKIRFKGRPAEPFSDIVRGKVAMLPQDAFLLKRSVYSNVAYGLKIKKQNSGIKTRVHEALDMVGLDPGTFARRPWFALSGGESRRVALAARLALQPEVLLLDEPTASVDAASAQMIKAAALHARQQWGTTLIVTSHDTEWLADISDNLLHLFRGCMLGNGRQTLIFGPWTGNGSGMLCRAFPQGQVLEASGHPPDPQNAVAAIEARQMRLYLTADEVAPYHRRLKGILLRLSYEQSTRLTSAAVLVGGMIFNVYLPEAGTDNRRFHPGTEVWVGYDPHSVAWF